MISFIDLWAILYIIFSFYKFARWALLLSSFAKEKINYDGHITCSGWPSQSLPESELNLTIQTPYSCCSKMFPIHRVWMSAASMWRNCGHNFSQSKRDRSQCISKLSARMWLGIHPNYIQTNSTTGHSNLKPTQIKKWLKCPPTLLTR